MHSDAAGPDIFEIPATDALGIARAPVVSQDKAHAVTKAFHFQPHRLTIVTIGVTDDVRAGLIQSQHQEFDRALIETRNYRETTARSRALRPAGKLRW